MPAFGISVNDPGKKKRENKRNGVYKFLTFVLQIGNKMGL